MPTYNFKCAKCGTVFSDFLPITYTVPPVCPDCNSPDTKQTFEQITEAPPVHFKGTGWNKSKNANQKRQGDLNASQRGQRNRTPRFNG